jgi:hypothetical protein
MLAATVAAIITLTGVVAFRTNTTTDCTALHTSVLCVGFHLLFFN